MSFTPLSRTGWTASSNDTFWGAASNVLDGNTSTIWETNGTMPCWLILDMNPPVTLSRTGWVITPDSTAGSFPASNLTDGNAGSIWSSSGGSTGFLNIDFGSAQTFTALLLQTRPSSNQGSPNAFDVYVSSDGVTWGTAIASFTGSSNSANQLTTYNLPGTQTTRYLRIVINSVYNGPSNIVLAEVYIANLVPDPTFNALTYLPRQDSSYKCPGSIEIYVSSDGVTWGTPILTQSNLPYAMQAQGFAFATQTKRYLKFNILSAAAGSVIAQGAAEVNVGTYTATGTVNILNTRFSTEAVITDAAPKDRLTMFGEDAILTAPTTPRDRLTRLSIEKVLVPGVFIVTQNLVTTVALESVMSIPAPLYRGHIEFDQVRATARKGAGSQFQMFGGGPTTAGHAAVYDSAGNVIDGGVAPGGSTGSGPGLGSIRAVSVNTTMTNADYTVVATAPSITITLPTAPVTGQIVNVKNGNPTTGQFITVTASVLIDVASSITLGATASLAVQFDGTQWRVI